MKSVFNRDFWKLENLRQTWEYKTISFMIRGFVGLIVIIYLLFTLPRIYDWTLREFARQQPPEHFQVILDRAQESGNFNGALRWLSHQDPAQSEYFLGVIEERSSDLPAPFFIYGIRHYISKNDTDGMLFWTMLMRYRLRYDVLRCGDPTLVDKLNKLFEDFYRAQQIDMSALITLEQDKTRLKKMLQRVLDFDAKNPARNDPRTTCGLVKSLSQLKSTPLPKAEWADIRHTLRTITESSLERMDASAP